MPVEERLCPVRPVTHGPHHHFFGYYDKTPWDASGRFLLALEVPFGDRPPGPDDVARIGLVEPGRGTFEAVAETRAWNWQQGCMLQWLPGTAGQTIIYNDRQEGQFVAVLLDLPTGRRRVLPHPIYALSHDGRAALGLNFSRLASERPGYGYAGVPDPWAHEPAPDDDGVYWLDLQTGERRLLLSLAQVAWWERHPTMEGVKHRFEHLLWSPDDRRFIVLHRWSRAPQGFFTRLFTAAADGSALCCLAGPELVSHFDWRDPQHILAWAWQPGQGAHYYLFTDCSPHSEVVGPDVLTTDGHCSYSPDRRWILTDTYPDQASSRTLLLYEPATDRRIDLARLYSPPHLRGELRCDLHPRWSRDGRQVCLDSAHTGERQMYVVDVAALTA